MSFDNFVDYNNIMFLVSVEAIFKFKKAPSKIKYTCAYTGFPSFYLRMLIAFLQYSSPMENKMFYSRTKV